jgi:hypothetical protein
VQGPDGADTLLNIEALRFADRTVTLPGAWSYLASNTDLMAVFGDDTAAALNHYLQYGIAEHRLTGLFDATAYLAKYADVRAAFGTNAELAAQHYVQYGYKEGRTYDLNGTGKQAGTAALLYDNDGDGTQAEVQVTIVGQESAWFTNSLSF